jgi:syntaxin 1B/2/3
MSVNRIDELKIISPVYSRERPAVEKPDTSTTEDIVFIDSQVSKISQDLSALESRIHHLKTIHSKMIQMIIAKKKRDLKDEYSSEMISIKNLIQNIGDNLNKFDAELSKRIKASSNDPNGEIYGNHTIIRMMQSHHFTLSNRFQTLLHDYFDIQESHKDLQNQRIRTQIAISKPELTEEQVDDLVLNGKDLQLMFKKALQGSQIGTLNTYYDEAVELRKDVYMIEESLKDLQELFVSFGQIMMNQQPLIDDIEENLTNADRDIRQGTEYLKQAPLKSITIPFL